jgi:hypothetical protein
MDDDEKIPPLPPFKDHGQECKQHKNSYLEDPMATRKERELMARIIDNYLEQ